MPTFFFHIRRSEGEIRDSEGSVLPDLEAARREAILSARSILSQEVLQGDLPLHERIDIEDPEGRLLLSVSFLETVNIRLNSRTNGRPDRPGT